MMILLAAVEKSPDADIPREMIRDQDLYCQGADGD